MAWEPLGRCLQFHTLGDALHYSPTDSENSVTRTRKNDLMTGCQADRTWFWCNALILVGTVASLLGCKSETPKLAADGTELEKVVLMLNWYPEAEHGGFYAAEVHGMFEKYGLDVEIRPGGPSAPIAQELVAGRVQFAVGNADDVLVFRNQDVPVVALMAPIQNTPRCILVHPDSPVKTLADLSGATLQAGAGRPYLAFMESAGLLDGVQLVPYSGVPKFVSDPKSAMQGYTFSEPLLARQAGVEPRALMVSDIGFNPYASCLIATEDYIAQHDAIVERMVAACLEGWQKYYDSPAETNALILECNKFGMTTEALEFGANELKALCLPDGMSPDAFGAMSGDRWRTLVEQFEQAGLSEPDSLTFEALFDDTFLNRAAPTIGSAE